MDIRLTAVPSGFWNSNDSKIAVVFTLLKPNPPATYDALKSEEKNFLSNWPRILKTLKDSGFSVIVEGLQDPIDAKVVSPQNWAQEEMEEAWNALFRPNNPFQNRNTLSGGQSPPGKQLDSVDVDSNGPAVTSYPISTVRETLRLFQVRAMQKAQLLRPANTNVVLANGSLNNVAPQRPAPPSGLTVQAPSQPVAQAVSRHGGALSLRAVSLAAAPLGQITAADKIEIDTHRDVLSLNVYKTDLDRVVKKSIASSPLHIQLQQTAFVMRRLIAPVVAPKQQQPSENVVFMKDRNVRRLTPDSESLSDGVAAVAEKQAEDSESAQRPKLSPDESFIHMAVFHRRVSTPASIDKIGHAGGRKAKTPASTLSPDFDIFQQLSMVWNYPTLLEPLGLVVLLKVSKPLPATGRISIAVKQAPAPTTGITNLKSLLTNYEWANTPNQKYFRAQDDPSQKFSSEGYLNLKDRNRFYFDNLDVDGSGIKLQNHIATQSRQAGAIAFTDASDPFGRVFVTDPSPASDLIRLLTGNKDPKVVNLEDLVPIDILKRFPPDMLRSTAWKTLDFQTKLQAADKSLMDGTGLVATAMRYEGTLYRIRWQLWASSAAQANADESHLPSGRSIGVGLIWSGRGADLVAKLQRSKDLKKNDAAGGLYAQDLILGYIPEICYGPPKSLAEWKPLTKRYEEFEDENLPKIITELSGDRAGGPRLPAAQTLDSPNGKKENWTSPDFHAHEMVFSWDGWPIGVEKPASFGLLNDEQGQQIRSRAEGQKAITESLNRWKLPVRTRLSKDARILLYFSLPGKPEARIRLPIVDVAGLRPGDPKDDNSQTFRYLRHEPVLPPEILLDERLSGNPPGRSVDRMVISPGHSSDARWCVPPHTSAEMAEKHRLLNVSSLREVGSFDDVQLLRDGTFPVVPAPRTPSDVSSANGKDFRKPEQKWPIRYPGSSITFGGVPYFPDPLARLLCARLVYYTRNDDGLPARAEIFARLPYYSGGNWPHARALKIALKESGANQPSMEISDFFGELTVYLPAGMNADLDLCSGLGNDEFATAHLESLALVADFRSFEVVDSKLTAKQADHDPEHNDHLMNGFIAQLRPWRTIKCVHAVPRPIQPPQIEGIAEAELDSSGALTISRSPGSTVIDLNFNVSVEAQSSGNLRLHANWNFIQDDPNQTSTVPCKQYAAKELSPVQIESDLGSGIVRLPTLKRQQSLPDTGYRKVEYIATADTRYREDFIQLPIASGQISSKAYTVEVLNCAKPPIPRVNYIVPTFGWHSGRADLGGVARFRSLRKGGGLRIWLDRPWCVSGDGELLGVLLQQNQRDALENLTTQWGLDPTRGFQRLEPFTNAGRNPSIEDFKKIYNFKKDVRVDEAPGNLKTANLVSYRPEFSPENNRWYCDVVVDPIPADHVFLRLALVRFQPKSITDKTGAVNFELSPVVLADFAQLVPDRSVTVSRDSHDHTQLKIEIAGSPNSLIPNVKQDHLQRDFVVLLFKPFEDGWIPDKDIVIQNNSDDVGVGPLLWSATIKFSNRRGPRRLLVVEREFTGGSQPEDIFTPKKVIQDTFSNERILYMDVLSL